MLWPLNCAVYSLTNEQRALATMARSLKVAVIGAGVSGLVAARELGRENHRVVIFEKQSQFGGTWAYDPRVETDPLSQDPNREIVHTSLYFSLRTNLPRPLMGFSDYPFRIKESGDPRTFPGHREVLSFLNDFTTDFGLTELIRFEAEVVRVERVDEAKWVVEWKERGGLVETAHEVFDAVTVCNGHFTVPRIPKIQGIDAWPGMQVHSHNYRVPDPFQDQVVVLIGSGASAFDISRDISRVAKEVHLSSRSPDVKIGKLESCDNIWQHSKVSCVYEDSKVAFDDGSTVIADIIFYCTGYNYDFPFLQTNGIVSIEDNCVGPLYKHVFPPSLAPSLSFIGIPNKVIIFKMLELQSKWVARVLSRKLNLASEKDMLMSVEELYKQINEMGIPRHYTHNIGSYDEFEYMHWLAAQVGALPLDGMELKMYSRAIKAIVSQYDKYRDEWHNLCLTE